MSSSHVKLGLHPSWLLARYKIWGPQGSEPRDPLSWNFKSGKTSENPQLLPIIVHAHPQLLSHQIYTHPGMPPPRTPPGTCTDSLTLRGKAATTFSQLPLPLTWSGGLTGQTIYNSEVWLKIVQVRFSLLGRRAGVARVKKGVETMTQGRVWSLPPILGRASWRERGASRAACKFPFPR